MAKRTRKVKIGLDSIKTINIEVVQTVDGNSILIIKPKNAVIWLDKDDAYEFSRVIQSKITEM